MPNLDLYVLSVNSLFPTALPWRYLEGLVSGRKSPVSSAVSSSGFRGSVVKMSLGEAVDIVMGEGVGSATGIRGVFFFFEKEG